MCKLLTRYDIVLPWRDASLTQARTRVTNALIVRVRGPSLALSLWNTISNNCNMAGRCKK